MEWIIIPIIVLGIVFFAAHYNYWRASLPAELPRILMYHSISDHCGSMPDELSVTPTSFERQLAALSKQDYEFFTVSELLARKNSGRPAVAITFDDGFLDNYTEAFPLIKKYKAKATIYLATNIRGIKRLSVEMIQEMQDSNLIEFGAHTENHKNLSTLSEEEAEQEIRNSKTRIEFITSVPCKTFAYPFGRYNDSNVAAVKAAGFKTAVTVKKGVSDLSDPLRLKRISILRSTNIFQFKLALSKGRYKV